MNYEIMELDKAVEWTTTTIFYYLKHRVDVTDKIAYLDKIIEYCEKVKENVLNGR